MSNMEDLVSIRAEGVRWILWPGDARFLSNTAGILPVTRFIDGQHGH